MLVLELTKYIIHEFNEMGFESLKPLPNKGGAGRPREFVNDIRLGMAKMALTQPFSLGCSLHHMVHRRLRNVMVEMSIVAHISFSSL